MAKSEQYKLKDPQTTFYDPETKFKVVGDEPSTIDPKKGKGKLTSQAIVAGGLIEVGTKSKSQAKDDGGTGDEELPQDFPARKALVKAGFDTVDKVKAASDEELIAVDGVAEKTLGQIREATK